MQTLVNFSTPCDMISQLDSWRCRRSIE